MKKIEKNEGVVINTTPYQENHVLCHILNEHGISTYLVRGVRKVGSITKNYCQPLTKISFNESTAIHFDKEKKASSTITECTILDNYTLIKSDLEKYNIALCMMEKLKCLLTNEADFKIVYPFFLDCLKFLKETAYPLSILSIFELKLTYLLGVMPSFKVCAKCKTTTSLTSFSVPLGGALCSSCGKNDERNKEILFLLKEMYYKKIHELDEEFFKKVAFYSEIEKIIDSYYEYHVEFYSKTKKIIRMLQK